MPTVRDTYDWLQLALAFVSVLGVPGIVALVLAFRRMRDSLDHISDDLKGRIEKLEKWRAAATGEAD